MENLLLSDEVFNRCVQAIGKDQILSVIHVASKTGNRCNQYKRPTVNGSAVTLGSFPYLLLST